VTSRYAPRSPDDVARLLEEHPLAWIVSPSGPSASLLPLRPVFGPDGAVTQLRGHFARANPQVEVLKADPRALILFLGPHGYVSPSHAGDRTQAPTWNYASAQFVVDVTLTDAPADIEGLLSGLAGAVEAGQSEPWTLADMGARYERLARGVIGFTAEVVEARYRFKLGQDERADLLPAMLSGLDAEGQGELADWMRSQQAK
jgi:predicted FMN-binding regulatory protein PaiB